MLEEIHDRISAIAIQGAHLANVLTVSIHFSRDLLRSIALREFELQPPALLDSPITMHRPVQQRSFSAKDVTESAHSPAHPEIMQSRWAGATVRLHVHAVPSLVAPVCSPVCELGYSLETSSSVYLPSQETGHNSGCERSGSLAWSEFALLSLRVVVLQQTRIARPCVRIVVRIKWTELTGTTGQDLHPAVLDQR